MVVKFLNNPLLLDEWKPYLIVNLNDLIFRGLEIFENYSLSIKIL